MNDKKIQEKDVLIIGGGPAGLTCALTLARGGRSVVVVDNNKPRNAPAKHMQNFPSQDGTPPAEFKKLILKDLEKYTQVTIINEEIQEITDFQISTKNGIYKFQKLALAYGVQDLLPELPGFKELWGKSLFHCPYCHGHEHRNAPMALLGGNDYLHHMAPLVYGLSKDLVAFSDGEILPDELKQKLQNKNIRVVENKIIALHRKGEELVSVEIEGGERIPRSYLFLRPPQRPKSAIGEKLGCALNAQNLYVVDDFGRTSVKNVYAAGDIVVPRQSVLNACTSGSNLGASINFDIASNDF